MRRRAVLQREKLHDISAAALGGDFGRCRCFGSFHRRDRHFHDRDFNFCGGRFGHGFRRGSDRRFSFGHGFSFGAQCFRHSFRFGQWRDIAGRGGHFGFRRLRRNIGGDRRDAVGLIAGNGKEDAADDDQAEDRGDDEARTAAAAAGFFGRIDDFRLRRHRAMARFVGIGVPIIVPVVVVVGPALAAVILV